MCILSTY